MNNLALRRNNTSEAVMQELAYKFTVRCFDCAQKLNCPKPQDFFILQMGGNLYRRHPLLSSLCLYISFPVMPANYCSAL